jgi:hypothetical protein
MLVLSCSIEHTSKLHAFANAAELISLRVETSQHLYLSSLVTVKHLLNIEGYTQA